MIETMKKIRERKNVLLDCSEVFVKDPLLDVHSFIFNLFLVDKISKENKCNEQ